MGNTARIACISLAFQFVNSQIVFTSVIFSLINISGLVPAQGEVRRIRSRSEMQKQQARWPA